MKAAKAKGFTLVEMMVVISLIGILMAIAIPSILSQRPLWRVNGAARAILTDMRLTQSRAIRSGDPHAIIFYAGQRKYEVIMDDGAGGGGRGDGLKGGSEAVLKTVELDVRYTGIKFGVSGAPGVGGGAVPSNGVDFASRGGANSVVFQPDSSAESGAVYLSPIVTPFPPNWQRAVEVVGNTGRVRVYSWDPNTGQWR